MAAASSTAGAGKSNLNKNKMGGDVKEHVTGCACDKCTYFQVTPVAQPISDGKAVEQVCGWTFGDVNHLGERKLCNGSVAAKQLMAGAMSRKIGKSKSQAKGLSELRLRIPYSFSMNCAAGGVLSSAPSILADANSAEWAALLALYDAYRVLGFTVDFGLTYQTPAGANGVDAMFFVMAYDPVDGTALTGVRNGTEYTQHKLCMARPVGTQGTTSANLSMTFNPVTGKPFQFRVTVQRNKAFAASSTAVAYAVGDWKIMNTAGLNQPDGYL